MGNGYNFDRGENGIVKYSLRAYDAAQYIRGVYKGRFDPSEWSETALKKYHEIQSGKVDA